MSNIVKLLVSIFGGTESKSRNMDSIITPKGFCGFIFLSEQGFFIRKPDVEDLKVGDGRYPIVEVFAWTSKGWETTNGIFDTSRNFVQPFDSLSAETRKMFSDELGTMNNPMLSGITFEDTWRPLRAQQYEHFRLLESLLPTVMNEYFTGNKWTN